MLRFPQNGAHFTWRASAGQCADAFAALRARVPRRVRALVSPVTSGPYVDQELGTLAAQGTRPSSVDRAGAMAMAMAGPRKPPAQGSRRSGLLKRRE